LPREMNQAELLEYIALKTGSKCLKHGGLKNKRFKKIALCTGAGEDVAFDERTADVFLTGEIKYHTALELKRQNIAFICAGHYETEVHFIDALADSLQKRINMLKYNVSVIKSETNTNPFDC